MTTNALYSNDAATNAAPLGSRIVTRYLPTTARLLLGLLFFVFGLNGFLNFIPPPTEPMPEAAMTLASAFMTAGYMFPLIKGTEVLVSIALLANRFVPLALVVLAPVMINIVAFHVFLVSSGLGLSLVLFGVMLYLAWVHRKSYAALLTARSAR